MAAGVATLAPAQLEMAAPATPVPPVRRSTKTAGMAKITEQMTPSRMPGTPPATSWPKVIVVPMEKNVRTMTPVRAGAIIFLKLGKTLPRMMPTTMGRMAPTSVQPMEAWPAAPSTIMVTGGPTTSVVMATAPRSASLPIVPMRPAYMALLAPVQAARITMALRPQKLLPVTSTSMATAMTMTCLAMMMIAPRAAAAGALLNEMVVPTMSRKAPTSGLTPLCVMPRVKLPSVVNSSGKSVFKRQPSNSGTKMVAPGMEFILKKGFFSCSWISSLI